MFLSRTVAAEICMEAKSNDIAYSVLKKLDRSGDLLFELRHVSLIGRGNLLLNASKIIALSSKI